MKDLSFPASESLCRLSDPHLWDGKKAALMAEACREFAEFHFKENSDIAFIYKRAGFDPKTIKNENDIARIPMLGVSAMKSFLIATLPEERASLQLTSSGTRGQKTRIWFDAPSLDRCQAMLEEQWRQEGLVSKTPTNYLMFVYDPEEAKDLGIAFSDKNQQRFAPVKKTVYAIKKDRAGAWAFQKEAVFAALKEFEKDGSPVRLFGMPGFVFETLAAMTESVRLPPGSWMVTGGGWKAAEDKKISREQFRKTAAERFGIPAENIRDGYGMAEHCAPYLECREHRFHVPAFCRVIPRDPVTLKPLPPGQVGLLELLSPYNAMMPNLAILTTDLGLINEEPCPCGYNSPTFALLGRGGLTKHKGCALHASDIVRRS